MEIITSPLTPNAYAATPPSHQPGPEWPAGLASSLVLPAHSSSIRLGRHVVLAWLQFAPQRYDLDAALALVTGLLANALEDSSGPLLLAVSAREEQLHIEVKDVSPGDGKLKTADLARITTASRHLEMISRLAHRWGSELRLTEDDVAVRVVWFECQPIGAEAGRTNPPPPTHA